MGTIGEKMYENGHKFNDVASPQNIIMNEWQENNDDYIKTL